MIREEREKLAGIGHNGGPPLHDVTLFFEFAADPEDDWKLEATLLKANPNAGISVGLDFLIAEQRDAIAKPRRQAIFKTKHLNIWVAAKAAYFDIEAWRRCRDETIPMQATRALALERFRGRRAILAIDLASIDDIAAMEYLILPEGEEATPADPFIRIGRYFLPADTVENVPRYAGWHAEQLLDVTDGPIIDYEEIEAAIDEACDILDVQHVAYDPHQATMLVTRLMKKNVPVIEYRPLVILFSQPMKELDGMMKAATLRHGGCPVMEWQVANVTAQPDKKDNVYPNKPRADAKIDNPVALIMAVGVALSGKTPEKFEYTGM
jgi:phage terminase large subunit-like protein